MIKFKSFLAFICSILLMSCGNNDVEIVKISAQRAQCTGLIPMRCLKIQHANSAEWTFLYDAIEGFVWEPGFEYVLEIQKENVSNPPADASSIKYKMLKLISKKFVGYSFEHSGKFVLKEMDGEPAEALFDKAPNVLPELSLDLVGGKIWGTGGCNEFSASFEMVKNIPSIGSPVSTRMMCENGAAEAKFFSFFTNKNTLEMLDNLIIVWCDGKEVLIFQNK